MGKIITPEGVDRKKERGRDKAENIRLATVI